MKVIICGAGQVGYGIAERLAAERNDVCIIDTAPALIQNVKDTLDVRGIVGHGAYPEVLEQAGAQDADMIIAVTLHDEINMIACQVAHSLFEVPTKIARVRSQAYLQPQYMDLFSRDHLPIDVVISPEVEVGEMILRRIALPGATEVVPFADGNVIALAIECLEECPVIDTPLSQLTELFPDLQATVVGIYRDGNLMIPHSSDRLLAGDLAYVIASKAQVRRTLGLFGHDKKEARHIVIAGGGQIGFYVAKGLEKRESKARVKLIERNRGRADEIADDLRHTVILHGSALDQNVLLEAGIDQADLIITLTNDDQANILSCVIAKNLGCKSSLALLNNPTYHEFGRTLGVDSQVNPRSVTVSRILQYVRRGRVRAVHKILKGDAEILEGEALETSALVGRSLKDLELPEGMRVGAIFRDGKVITPSGALIVQPRDRVVIFALAGAVKDVERLFRVGIEFFA